MRLSGPPNLASTLWRRGTSSNQPGGHKPQVCASSACSLFTIPTETYRLRNCTSASAEYGVSTATDEGWLYGLLEPDNGFVTGISNELAAFMFREI